jgi:ketosteroid isomerase-like protein
MFEDKVRLVRAFYEAHSSRDLQRAEQLMDPEFEFVPSSASHFSGPVRGARAFNRGLAELIEQFESFDPIPEEILDAGDDRIVVALRRTARSQGVELQDRVAHVITMRGERISRIAGFVTLAEAKRAVGLTPADPAERCARG